MTLTTPIDSDGRGHLDTAAPAAVAVAAVCRRQAAQLPDSCLANLFTHPAYLEANGISDVVLVARTDPLAGPACFADRGSHFLHLGRLDCLDEPDAYRLAQTLLDQSAADFVIFEDLNLVQSRVVARPPALRLTYQGNWRLGIAPGEVKTSGSRRRQMAKLARRLEKFAGNEMRFVFGRTQEEIVDRVVGLNREKIERSGRRHHLGEEKLRALKAVCASVGYEALLYCGDELVAGDILCVVGQRGYVMVSGYDTKYDKFTPGLHTYSFAMEQLQSIGCTEANFLWGDNPMKARLGAVRQQLSTIVVARSWWSFAKPSLRAAWFPYVLAGGKDIVKRHVIRRWKDLRQHGLKQA